MSRQPPADRVAVGLRWTALGSVAVRVVGGVRGLLIARLVGPRALGLFAAVLAFSSLANILADVGLQTFLVSRGQDARRHAREVFELALGAGVLGALGLAAAAVPLAALYDDHAVTGVALALSISVLMTALAVVPNALLRVDMRFKEVARAQVGGEAAALVVGVALAAADAGVWALVGAVLASQAATLALLWATRPGSIRPTPRVSSRGATLRFGGTIALGGLVWSVALQGDNVAIGRLAGATALGFYAFAYNYGVLPGVTVGGIVTDVALASFVNAESDEGRRDLFLRFARITVAVSAPLVAIGVAFAPHAVRYVLGDVWVPAIRPLQVMLVLGFVRGLLPAEVLLRAVRRVNVELWIGVIAAPLTLVAAVWLAHRGITTVAVVVVAIQAIAAAVSTVVALRQIRLSVRALLAAVVWPMLVAGGLAGIARTVASGAALSELPALLVAALGLLVYLAALKVTAPTRWLELREVIRARAAVEVTPQAS